MKTSRIAHGTFSIERIYDAVPQRVFDAWSSTEAKAPWFVGPMDWTQVQRELDFRVGGHEILKGRFPSGLETHYSATFHAIEPAKRLAFVYDMFLSNAHHSVSLATVEFEPMGAKTRLTFTEQVAFLDGTDGEEGTAARHKGTDAHLERLERLVGRR
jgi:uncharacterized protein YndB with AHSA1/START domain